MNVYADGIKPPGPTWISSDPAGAFSNILSIGFQVLLVVAGIYAALQIILAGYGMISSGGDAKALGSARSKIIWAIIGVIIVVASWGLIMLVQSLLGTCLGFGCPINFSE
jgi:hypothetical protein